jgi:hypothetical protein
MPNDRAPTAGRDEGRCGRLPRRMRARRTGRRSRDVRLDHHRVRAGFRFGGLSSRRSTIDPDGVDGAGADEAHAVPGPESGTRGRWGRGGEVRRDRRASRRRRTSTCTTMTGQRIDGRQWRAGRGTGSRCWFLYGVEPQRYDVVVFKCPYDRRPASSSGDRAAGEQWRWWTGMFRAADGGRRGRARGARTRGRSRVPSLPEASAVQEAVWQPVLTAGVPLNPVRDGRPWRNPPWAGSTPGWKIDGRSTSSRDGDAAGVGRDAGAVCGCATAVDRLRRAVEIDDRYPQRDWPDAVVADAVPGERCAAAAGGAAGRGLEVTATVAANHEFEAVIRGNSDAAVPAQRTRTRRWIWKVLTTGRPLAVGRVTDVELWHADRAVQWIAGGWWQRHARLEPGGADQNSTGQELSRSWPGQRRIRSCRAAGRSRGTSGDGPGFGKQRVRWAFNGAAVRLHRVIDRDPHYQPSAYRQMPPRDQPAAGDTREHADADGGRVLRVRDNSPASHDGRLWTTRTVGGTDRPEGGVVPRDLLLGKAFFVYFPSLHKDGRSVPDFGRLRFIRWDDAGRSGRGSRNRRARRRLDSLVPDGVWYTNDFRNGSEVSQGGKGQSQHLSARRLLRVGVGRRGLSRAFVPDPLPPTLAWTPRIISHCRGRPPIGKLAGCGNLPNPHLLIGLQTAEAVLSTGSRHRPASRTFLFEGRPHGTGPDDVREVPTMAALITASLA